MKHERRDILLGGIVYTPDDVADALCSLLKNNIGCEKIRILEPSAGDGVFLSAIRNSGIKYSTLTAVDNDELAANHLKTSFEGINLFKMDFLEYALNPRRKKFDLIIGNPPYIRRHNFNDKFLDLVSELGETVADAGIQIKNAWLAFILASLRLLNPRGTIAFVVPYELMNVNYGKALLNYLSTRNLSVNIYIPDNKAFKSIDQDAVILIISNRRVTNNEINIHRVKSLSELQPLLSRSIDLTQSESTSIDLKSFLLNQSTVDLLHRLRAELKPISDYCESRAGIVTAANDFFILTQAEIKHFKLESWARKILKKGSFLSAGPRFMRRHFSSLAQTQPCYLVDFRGLPFSDLPAEAQTYIEYGLSQEIDQRYKCKKRTPWYKVPIVPVSEGFFFKRSHLYPRLCSNDAKVLVTDTAYQIGMREGYSIPELIFSFYNSVTLLFAEIDGRFYGGGVLELTPLEFRGLPMFYQNPSKEEYTNFLNRFPATSESVDSFFDKQDKFLRKKIRMSEQESESIREALTIVRNHRLRHGNSNFNYDDVDLLLPE